MASCPGRQNVTNRRNYPDVTHGKFAVSTRGGVARRDVRDRRLSSAVRSMSRYQ